MSEAGTPSLRAAFGIRSTPSFARFWDSAVEEKKDLPSFFTWLVCFNGEKKKEEAGFFPRARYFRVVGREGLGVSSPTRMF